MLFLHVYFSWVKGFTFHYAMFIFMRFSRFRAYVGTLHLIIFLFICETSKGVVVSCVLNTDIGFFDSVVFLSKNSAVLRFFLFLRDVLMAAFLAVEICFLSFKLLSLRIFMCMW